jgi:hypothetical protein
MLDPAAFLLQKLLTASAKGGGASQWQLVVFAGISARAILCSPCAPPSKRQKPFSMHHCSGWQ